MTPVGIIGYGSKSLTSALVCPSLFGSFEIVGCFSPGGDPSSLAACPGIIPFKTAEALVNNSEIIILESCSNAYEYACTCLKHRCHLLVLCPELFTREQIRTLSDLSSESGAHVRFWRFSDSEHCSIIKPYAIDIEISFNSIPTQGDLFRILSRNVTDALLVTGEKILRKELYCQDSAFTIQFVTDSNRFIRVLVCIGPGPESTDRCPMPESHVRILFRGDDGSLLTTDPSSDPESPFGRDDSCGLLLSALESVRISNDMLNLDVAASLAELLPRITSFLDSFNFF